MQSDFSPNPWRRFFSKSLIYTFHLFRNNKMFAPACKKTRNFQGSHCTSQPLCNESRGESWEPFAKSSAAKMPLLELAMLLAWGTPQQSTNTTLGMWISRQLLPYNLEELQEDTFVSLFLWMGIALVKMGKKPRWTLQVSINITLCNQWHRALERNTCEGQGRESRWHLLYVFPENNHKP